MSPYSITNFETQKYYQDKPELNGDFARIILPKTKDGAYVINLDEYKSIGTYWIVWYVTGNLIYFGGVKSIVLSVKNIKNIKILKYHIFFNKTLVTSINYDKYGSKRKRIFKEKESIEILKFLGLINYI